MIVRRSAIVGGLFAALTISACRDGDAASDTSAAIAPVLVGPENIVVIKAQELRTGPTLSGTIRAEREATMRAEVTGSVMQTYVEPASASPPVRSCTPGRQRHSRPGAVGARQRSHGEERV